MIIIFKTKKNKKNTRITSAKLKHKIFQKESHKHEQIAPAKLNHYEIKTTTKTQKPINKKIVKLIRIWVLY